METIFMNTENSKTNEPHKFILNLSQRLYFKRINILLFITCLFITPCTIYYHNGTKTANSKLKTRFFP